MATKAPRAQKMGELLSPAALGRAYRTEWIDFDRGIRVGNLEPEERITQIFKSYLQSRYEQPFVCDRWGRGAFWQWICWVPRRDREAKPISHDRNWSCAKFFISAFTDTRVFKCGIQVERGPAVGPEQYRGSLLKPDWDWQQLMRQLRKGSALDKEVARLLRDDGFEVWVGDWDKPGVFDGRNYRSAGQLKRALKRIGDTDWAGFQLYYPMPEPEVHGMRGPEFIEAVCAVFAELTPAIDCMLQVQLSA